MKRWLAAILVLSLPAVAAAGEKPVALTDAPGRDVVESNCGACHSLDYIRTNSPFMDRQVWTAEVNKMINVMGAPIGPDDAKTVIEYLVRNYGKPG